MRRKVNFRLCRDRRRGESPTSFHWYGRAKTRVPAQCKPCPNGYSPLQKQSCAPQGGLGEKEFSDGNFVQHRTPSKTLKIKCFTNCQSFALAAPEPPPRGGRFATPPSVRTRWFCETAQRHQSNQAAEYSPLMHSKRKAPAPVERGPYRLTMSDGLILRRLLRFLQQRGPCRRRLWQQRHGRRIR